MGKFREITGAKKEKAGIREATGVSARAGQEAARVLRRGTRQAIGEIEDIPETVGATLDPFISAGQQALGGIFGAISPQRDFELQTDPSRVLQNPFFQALAAEQEQRLMASQAARGKVGAGETTNLLQRNLLQLGSQFQQQDIANQLAQAQAQSQLEQQRYGQLFGLGQMGFGAAGQLAGTQEATATNLANLIQSGAAGQASALTGIGNIQAAGIRGAAQTQAQGQRDLFNLRMETLGMLGGMFGMGGGSPMQGLGGSIGTTPTTLRLSGMDYDTGF